jgi:hypothetical protein
VRIVRGVFEIEGFVDEIPAARREAGVLLVVSGVCAVRKIVADPECGRGLREVL